MNRVKIVRALLIIQFALSAIGFGLLTWHSATYFKVRLIGKTAFALYPWTTPFFRPLEANLINYMALCVVFALCGIIAYLMHTNRPIESSSSRLGYGQAAILIVAIIASVWILPSCLKTGLSVPRLIGKSAIVSFGPWALLTFTLVISADFLKRKGANRVFLLVACCLLLFVFREQYQLIKGRVYLMNDYPDIYGETIINGRYTDNRVFLEKLASLSAKEEAQSPEEHPAWWLFQFDSAQSAPARMYLDLVVSTSQEAESDRTESYKADLRGIDAEAIKSFHLANLLESIHQNSGRGQINHMGHVLNPINEYQLGKPLSEIYIQYGLGNTLLSKWAMELFGGVSVQNYYKTYIYYSLYYLSFLAMLIYVFGNGLYVLGAFAAIPACFFFMGYTAYIVAPGIIPSIHLLDACTAIFLVSFMRHQKRVHLAIAILLSLVSILINAQFGIGLSVALLSALFVYFLENRRGMVRIKLLAALGGIFLISGVLFRASKVGLLNEVSRYFFAGLFSWPVSPAIVLATIIYLFVSYLFLLWLKNERSYLKYLYIFVFAYSQSILVYYYWSGLVNHLPPVFPFVWLQLFLMLFITQNVFFRNRSNLSNALHVSVGIITFASVILVPFSSTIFYHEKNQFWRNFQDHRVYRWEFKRAAGVRSTFDPATFQEALSQIEKYGRRTVPGIYMLSKYDNLLPFLAGKYNSVPFFEVVSYVFSKKEYDMVVNKIKADRPEYLFADTNIDCYRDAWYLFNKHNVFETRARLERYALLKQMFKEVQGDYEKIDQGTLLTVYKRKGA